MSLRKALPRAPENLLVVLENHTSFSKDDIEGEISYIQVLAYLLKTLFAGTAQTTPEIDLEDEVGMPVKMSCHRALAVRTLYVAQLVLRTWEHTHSWEHRAYLYKVLGVVDYISNVSSLYRNPPGAAAASPTAFRMRNQILMHEMDRMYTCLLVATSWANAMTGYSAPRNVLPHEALSNERKPTPLIHWEAQAHALQGVQHYYTGMFSKARKAFRRAVATEAWVPPRAYRIFLDTSPLKYAPDISQPQARALDAAEEQEEAPFPDEYKVHECVLHML